jgi:DNA replicative helicase MCM subunit Mcm2 (Cdc46/Mcm family)
MEIDLYDKTCELLEKIITSRLKIEDERHYSNHREVWNINDTEYKPAFLDLKTTLKELIHQEIKNVLSTHQGVSCEWSVVSSHLDQVDYTCKKCGYQTTVAVHDGPECKFS